MVAKIIYGFVIFWLILNAIVTLTTGVFFWSVIPHMVLIPICIWGVVVDYRTNTWKSLGGLAGLIVGLQITWLIATLVSPWTIRTELAAYIWALLIGAGAILTLLVGLPLLLLAHKIRS